MDDTTMHEILRVQAWERAKGELRSMFHTFFGEPYNLDHLSTVVDRFIKEIEDNGLHQ